MKNDYKGWTVKLEVHNVRDTIKSSNVIGYITGSVEPDRQINDVNLPTLNYFIMSKDKYSTLTHFFIIQYGNKQNVNLYIFTKQIRDAWKSQGRMGIWCSRSIFWNSPIDGSSKILRKDVENGLEA